MKKNGVLNQMMKDRQSTTALQVPRSLRPHDNAFLAKMSPGKVVPIAAAGLHREDAVTAGMLQCLIEMSETAEVLINPVHVKVSAYLVPWLAFERFNGRDEFEASYSKVPFKDGDPVIPFIETMPRGVEGDHPVLDSLGLHTASFDLCSTMYIEAYNQIVNYRNKNRSLDLPERARLDSTLAPAQRELARHRNIVPNFDDAAMEGAVEVELLNQGALPVHGIGGANGIAPTPGPIDFTTTAGVESWDNYKGDGSLSKEVYMKTDQFGTPQINVELQDANLQFSLANIAKARQLQQFAELRKRFSGLDDEAIINKLMDGIRMPEKMFEQPIYLGSEMAAFNFQKRYSSDSQNLDESVVRGVTQLTMQLATPRINTGGVLMFIAEIQPEQLFERQADPFFVETDVEKYPQTMRDFLDEQKVDIVRNKEIDTAHVDPDGVFGYGPLNGRWQIQAPRIGTGYFAPAPTTTFDEDRNRIWDTTPANPSLGTDWYLTNEVSQDVFEYTEGDPFETSGRLSLVISGNTVFGQMLEEDDGNYEAVAERAPAPEDQVDQDA